MNWKNVYRTTISDREYVMPYGKFKGESIATLIDIAPDYLTWLIGKDMIDLDHKIIDELEYRNPWMAKA